MKKQFIYLLLTALVIIMASCSKDDEILEPAKSSAKQITSFVFKAVDNDAITEDVTAVINETNKTISATVANGTDIKSLTPVIVVSDKASAGQSGAKDFSSPVEYTITAEDGTSTTYKITVSIALNSAKQILSFAFIKEYNELYGNETITATIDEANKTITATVSYSANAALLTQIIEVSSNASVSPDIAQDFSNPVAYTITAEDGTSTSYQVILEITFTNRDALIAIYNANPNNTLDWDLNDMDINNWTGVYSNNQGDVIRLFMDSENLDGLPPELGQLTMLIELDVNDNNLTELPEEIGELINMIYLTIDDNHISELPKEIGQLIKLTDLYSSNNKLTKLPEQIGDLSNLDYFQIDDNQLITLPGTIGKLSKLTHIELGFNKLTTIPPEIGQLKSLQGIALLNNQLTSLPKEIGELTSLTSLDLTRNELTSIPLELGNLTSLSGLYLSENKLTSIPKEIGKLTTLTRLVLTENLLTGIPLEVCKLEDTGTIISIDSGVKCE